MEHDIKSLKGVGEKKAAGLLKLKISTAEELLYFFPRKYEDRSENISIEDCADGKTVCVSAFAVTAVNVIRTKGGRTISKLVIKDETALMEVVWYNNKYLKNVFTIGKRYVFYGKVSKVGSKLSIVNPVYEPAGVNKYLGKIVPLYPLCAGLSQKNLQSFMESALNAVLPLSEFLPDNIIKDYRLSEINFAMKNIHFPDNLENYKKARQRFVFDELLILQLALLSKKGENDISPGFVFKNVKCVREFTDSFPYELTDAQKRTINEICADFKSGIQMNRLVQGDVGSGKTAVAAAALYIAVKNGMQGVFMAPTEILASQHFETLTALFKDFGINVVKLVSGMSAKEKRNSKAQAENGEADIIVGTHAVIQENVKYKNLGLAIADEQHRFGVEQRAKLMAKGNFPHMLIMSATPIPRTLSLILYGDLKISVIDELPPGRKPVKTYAVDETMRRRVYNFLEKNVKEGNQAYVVCPLITETQSEDLKNAEDLSEKLRELFPSLTVGLVHGKMKAAEKDTVMESFSSGETDILVSTTVIEVGVNVPKANIMIIENAERFGLSQLHQLRGRVGRGADQSFCILFYKAKNEVTRKRMKIMCESNDGFYISEEDLKLRGPGDIFGTRQHGLPEMKIANLFEDNDILSMAQDCAKKILKHDPLLQNPAYEGIKKKIEKLADDSIVLN